jgi:hypothetical protein
LFERGGAVVFDVGALLVPDVVVPGVTVVPGVPVVPGGGVMAGCVVVAPG